MKSFKEYVRDAERYRALRSTDKASPWENVLGGQPNLDGLADALVGIIKKDHLRPTAKTLGIREEGEGAPANNIVATPGIDQPPILLGKKKLSRRPKLPEPVGSIVRFRDTPSN